MPIPTPKPGLVINYAYLWHSESRRGQEEGVKIRPCVIVLDVAEDALGTIVTVAPVTHREPDDPQAAVELPAETKRRLGLDAERSWVILTEVNRFSPTSLTLATVCATSPPCGPPGRPARGVERLDRSGPTLFGLLLAART
ncbi:MAG: type II toxin-antitoxin system PemK/MazF family toxin, partial [Alphaproteobacteria bacterium]